MFQQIRGERAPTARALAQGSRQLVPVLGIAGLMVVGYGMGLALCVVPGLLFRCAYYVVVPAAVVEGGGIRRAFARSAFLTRGSRWLLLALLLAFIAIGRGVQAVVEAVLPDPIDPSSVPIVLVLHYVFGALIGVWSAVAATVAYHDLRLAKEGVDVARMARVFE